MNEEREATIRVGPAGWAYEDWSGRVYPEGMPRSQHALSLLCELFDTVEINVSFYRPLTSSHAAAWIGKTKSNPGFVFTAKIWERFTHHRENWPEAASIRQCLEGLAPLRDAGKLGALLAQFPWSFRRNPENRSWLLRMADAFEGFPLAVEVRHISWDCPEFYAGLRERGIAFCNIDQPLLRDSIAPSRQVTAPMGYIRLHGRNTANWFKEGAGRDARYNYLYSEEELAPWIEAVKKMKRQVNDLFIITNNHYRGQAVVNALEIQAALGQLKGVLPIQLAKAYPRLKKYADCGEAPALF